jgi:hypothetical protein
MSELYGEKFELRLIPTRGILLHEECEDDRAQKLLERFKYDKVLFNPLTVGEYYDKLILIDGANRFEALRGSGCKIILAQIVNYNTPTIQVRSWFHYVPGLTINEVTGYLQKNGVEFTTPGFNEFSKGLKRQKINHVGIVSRQKESVCIKFNSNFREMLNGFCMLNEFYEKKYNYSRVNSDFKLRRIEDISSRDGLLFIYPEFKKKNIIKISGLKEKLPAGITRHLIPNRVLHIRFPISLLKRVGDLKKRNEELQFIVDKKIEHKKVRLYKEPLLIFDE